MFVPVVAVSGVQVPVVQIVDMISVRNRSVSAVGTVLMFVMRVSNALVGVAHVPMVSVLPVAMSVVHEIDVVAVLHHGMPAVGAVHMRMAVVCHQPIIPTVTPLPGALGRSVSHVRFGPAEMGECSAA